MQDPRFIPRCMRMNANSLAITLDAKLISTINLTSLLDGYVRTDKETGPRVVCVGLVHDRGCSYSSMKAARREIVEIARR